MLPSATVHQHNVYDGQVVGPAQSHLRMLWSSAFGSARGGCGLAGAALASDLVGHVRDELPAVEAFSTLLEVRVLVQNRRIEYNTVRLTAPWAIVPLPSTRPPGHQLPCTLISSGPATGSIILERHGVIIAANAYATRSTQRPTQAQADEQITLGLTVTDEQQNAG